MFVMPHRRKHLSNIITNGLLGYWPINENGGSTLFDASGNGNNLALVGGSWGTDNGEVALTLNGNGEYALAVDDCGVGGVDVATLIFRLKMNSHSINQFMIGIQDIGQAGRYTAVMAFIEADAKYACYKTAQNNDQVTVNHENRSMIWYDIAIIFNYDDFQSVYYNGVLTSDNGRTGGATGPIRTGGIMSIGRDEGDAGRDASMSIKWARWYNRALSGQEILDINAGNG